MATPKVTRRAFVLGGAAAAAAVALPAWTTAAANRASGYARLMRELRAATRGPVVTRQNAGLMVAAQIGIALAHGSWGWLMWLPLAVGVTTFTLAHSHVSLSFPTELTGRAFSAFNLMLFVGMFLSQWAFGALVDAFGVWLQAGEAMSFRAAMAVWALIQALGFKT